ncbi:MAG: hypothetical protein OXN95_05550, partial [bacterium]|nr:hypothetical protein [bacterium]
VVNRGSSVRARGYVEVGFFDSAGRRVERANDLWSVPLGPGESVTRWVDTLADQEWSSCRVAEFNWLIE